MADFDTAEFRANRFSRNRADELADRTFPVVMRGYDRAAVDAFVEEVAELVGDLESRQSRETVVQRAIEEVGEETAGILQRAHETADEIAARSRAQAEGRIQRAEREAELLRQRGRRVLREDRRGHTAPLGGASAAARRPPPARRRRPEYRGRRAGARRDARAP